MRQARFLGELIAARFKAFLDGEIATALFTRRLHSVGA